MTIRSPCEVCGNDNSIYPSDDFPPYLTVFVAGHIIVALFIWTDNVYDPPLWIEFAIWLPVTVLMCLALLPFYEGCSGRVVLGDGYCSPGIGDVTSSKTDLLVLEYQEINVHLRTNTAGFVNWFSFFLTFSIVAAIHLMAAGFVVSYFAWFSLLLLSRD